MELIWVLLAKFATNEITPVTAPINKLNELIINMPPTICIHPKNEFCGGDGFFGKKNWQKLWPITPLSAQISASKFQNLSQIPLKNRGVWENSL